MLPPIAVIVANWGGTADDEPGGTWSARRPGAVGGRSSVAVCASSTRPTGTWAVVPPRGDADAPGGVRRPPGRGWSRASGSTWSSSPATSTTGRSPTSTRCVSPTRRWRLAASRAKVVITSGNHDSAQRLGFSSRLIDAAGVFIRTDAAGAGTPVLLDDRHGTVAVYGIPYLDPTPSASRGGSRPGPTRRPSPRRCGGCTPTGRPATPQCRPRPRLRGRARSRATPSATSVSGVSPSCRPACSRMSTTRRSATCTAVRRSPTTCASRISAGLLLLRAGHVKGSWLVELGADGFERRTSSGARPRRLARIAAPLDDLLHDRRSPSTRTRGCRPR